MSKKKTYFFLIKVETIGDAYMVVSGAPVKESDHADRVCDMALDMVEAITDLKDRSTGTSLIRYSRVIFFENNEKKIFKLYFSFLLN